MRWAWERRNRAALFVTIPYMAFGKDPAPGTVQEAGRNMQADGYDLMIPRLVDTDYGDNIAVMRAARDDTDVPLMFVGYSLEGRICARNGDVDTGEGAGASRHLAASTSYHGMGLADELVYDVTVAPGAKPSTTTGQYDHAVITEEGNYVNRLSVSALRAKIINYYKSMVSVSPTTAATWDAVMPDTIGTYTFEDKFDGTTTAKSRASATNTDPNRRPPWYIASGDAAKNDIDAYMEENKTFLRDLQRGGTSAAGDTWAAGLAGDTVFADTDPASLAGTPVIFNGLVAGPKYQPNASGADGVNSNPTIANDQARNTLRYTNGNGTGSYKVTGGMFETMLVGINQGFTDYPTGAQIIATLDAIIDMEFAGQVAVWCTKRWITNAGAGAAAVIKQDYKFVLATFLLAANGWSYFSYRDDPKEETHRALPYPTGAVTGGGTGTTTGRRHQFPSQFFSESDQWMRKTKKLGRSAAYTGTPIGAGTPDTYRHYYRPTTVVPSGGGLGTGTAASRTVPSDRYLRKMDDQAGPLYYGGIVYVNNSASAWSVTPPAGTYREIETLDGAAVTTYSGSETVSVPAHSGLILIKQSASGPPTVYSYHSIAAVEVSPTSWTVKCSTDNPNVPNTNGKGKVSLNGGAFLSMTADGNPAGADTQAFTLTATGLTPGTVYEAVFKFYETSGAEAGTVTATAYFTTDADVTGPTFPAGATIHAKVKPGRIILRHPPATPDVTEYRWIRTAPGRPTRGFTVDSASPPPTVLTDDTVKANVQYTYSLRAVNANGSSSPLTKVVTASSDDGSGGWA